MEGDKADRSSDTQNFVLAYQKSWTFDRVMQYRSILSVLKREFDVRWRRNDPSPNTGLDGFEVHAVIGAGTFGRVKLVKDAKGNSLAVKVMLKSKIMKLHYAPNILNEKRVLQAVRFPFVIQSLFSRKDNDCLYLGMKLMQGGELFALHRKFKKFDERQARFYAAQVCLGLEYLHAMRLVYRDLKLENTLMDFRGYIKLADFGFTKLVEGRTWTLCGTPEYLSPEILQSKPYFSGPDWWAFGIFIYEMVEGQTPFARFSEDFTYMYEKICDGDYIMPKKFTEVLKDLIDRLLVVEMSKRLGCLYSGAADIKEHPWFRGMDWLALLNKEVTPPWVPNIDHADDLRYFPSSLTLSSVQSPFNRYSREFKDF